MTRRTLFLATLLCLAPLARVPVLAQSPAATAPPVKTHHVIFAVTSPDVADWNLTMGNTRNLIKGLSPDPFEIEIVAFGPGISLLKLDSPVAKDIAALQAQGVKFTACQNAMRFNHLELKDLIPGAIPVPAGIVELVTKQEQGWIYVKGGR
jgi:intracellular sulfur oxidation DsrE/DsrF family protein